MRYRIGNSCKIEIDGRVLNIDIQICNKYIYIYIACIQISTSISSIQLCECCHVESELSCMLCKWTDCTLHLENTDMKDFNVTVVLWLHQWPRQCIVQCIHQLVHPYYSQISLWKWELFLTVSSLCTEPFAVRDPVVANRKTGLRQCSGTFRSDTHPLIVIRFWFVV